MHQVVVTFLAAAFAAAETLGIHLYYIMRVPPADINPTNYPFVWAVTTVITLDVLFNLWSAAAGQGDRKLWWLDLFVTLGRFLFVLGAWVVTVLFWQGPLPTALSAVPTDLWVLVGLTAWAILDLRLQWHKKEDVMAHVAAARAVGIVPTPAPAPIAAPAVQASNRGGGIAFGLFMGLLIATLLGLLMFNLRTSTACVGCGTKTTITIASPTDGPWEDVTGRR